MGRENNPGHKYEWKRNSPFLIPFLYFHQLGSLLLLDAGTRAEKEEKLLFMELSLNF